MCTRLARIYISKHIRLSNSPQYIDGSGSWGDFVVLDIEEHQSYYGYIANHEPHYFRVNDCYQSYHIEIQGAYSSTQISRGTLRQRIYSCSDGWLKIFHLPQYNSNYYYYLDFSHIDDGEASFSISGKTELGEILSIDQVSSDPDGNSNSTLSYQWETSNDGITWDIKNTDSTFEITVLDLGKSVRCNLQYVDDQGFDEEFIASIDIPTGETAAFSIIQNTNNNYLLELNQDTVFSYGDVTNVTYQWQRQTPFNDSWENIGSGANYRVQRFDKAIRCIVSYVDTRGYQGEIISSEFNVDQSQYPTYSISDLNVNSYTVGLENTSSTRWSGRGEYVSSQITTTTNYVDSIVDINHKEEVYIIGKTFSNVRYRGGTLIPINPNPTPSGWWISVIETNSDTVTTIDVGNNSISYDSQQGIFTAGTETIYTNTNDAELRVIESDSNTKNFSVAIDYADPQGNGNLETSALYSWQISNNIRGEPVFWNEVGTSSHYEINNSDEGKFIRAIVSYTDGKEFLEEVTTTSKLIPFLNSGRAEFSINGIGEVGNKLTIIEESEDIDGNGSLSYVWQSSTDNINWSPVGSSSTLILSSSEEGSRIRAILSYTDAQGFSEEVTISPIFVAITEGTALNYLASNPDLITAFGTNTDRAINHYTKFGKAEGRTLDNFDEWGYLASNNDLLNAFGGDTTRAIKHYISFGMSEGRRTDGFNAAGYLNSYTDLSNSFGNDQDLATRHYVRHGFNEGRTLVA